MDKPILKDSLKLFDHFGSIKSRSMFGGFGIFSGDTMFALVVNDKLHLRANAETEKEFKQAGLEPYVYKKRGFPVVTKHYAIPDQWWDEPTKIVAQGRYSLDAAEKDKQEKESCVPDRIKDLPNLRLSNERMLKKAGIKTIEQLQAVGSLGAYKALQESQKSPLSIELLWALEGAISGQHWSVIPEQRRNELLSALS
ncbi:DNA transformation protein [Photobacterium angustum]|uniref:DNA transformation protein n=1 Tax=Photobacterium angustum TaxID=661 RepID=A0A855S9L3_PHOAN|nr:TfoX/Sxy family DNA transformation protein [Photobacterium angustum]KJF81725.1 DNA transformation protein [Photobacterium damselae subsp. damselae]KJG36624.1 DNA transformation protein [Photobacterium angustum]KJG45399.1 DNA transformation protein [Photobacterium angustum]KJG46061.1 DNA transformation protein [Photobacterium angustum]PSW87994.1 DNA transformation protein [Photobacterium angustum]